MKRPQRKKYDIGKYGEMKYIDRLERYCSYIENKNQALQLQQAGVMRSACTHDEKTDTKAYAKNGHEFIGYYCEKCDTVYCGSI